MYHNDHPRTVLEELPIMEVIDSFADLQGNKIDESNYAPSDT